MFFASQNTDIAAIEEQYKSLSTVPCPSKKTLYTWRKMWAEKRFHVRDKRAGCDKLKPELSRVILKALKRAEKKSSREVSRMTIYLAQFAAISRRWGGDTGNSK